MKGESKSFLEGKTGKNHQRNSIKIKQKK